MGIVSRGNLRVTPAYLPRSNKLQVKGSVSSESVDHIDRLLTLNLPWYSSDDILNHSTI
jgi:hypothetical protein